MLSGVPIPSKNGEVISDIVATMLLTHGLVTEVSGSPPPPQAVAKNDKSNIVFFIDVIIHQHSASYTGYYSYYFYYIITGTPARSRTERIFPFERNDFANLSTGASWCGRWDSNPQNSDFKSDMYTNSITTTYWCPPRDSNPHTFRHGLLRTAWLPVTSKGQYFFTMFYILT